MRSKVYVPFPAAALALFVLAGCAPLVAPVIRGPARPPARHLYGSAHGIPNAYGDGVCALEARHTHSYPPVPADAYRLEGDAHIDTRARYPYEGPHAHHGRSCFREGWHMHLEPPLPTLQKDAESGAYHEPAAPESAAP